MKFRARLYRSLLFLYTKTAAYICKIKMKIGWAMKCYIVQRNVSLLSEEKEIEVREL